MPLLRHSAATPFALRGVNLVFHQGYEGRDDEGETGEGQGGNLVAEGLPAAGGHEDEGVPSVHDGGDDFRLERSEGVVAEVSLEEFAHGFIIAV